MANEYLINKSDLTSVANAIREKGETNAQLVFPSGFVTAIQGIKSGVDLNFKVVGGTTQPSNPNENTLWVNTNVEITDWYISANQPESVDGIIWIETYGLGSVSFNTTESNKINITISKVHQFIDGEWKTVTAKIYQNQEWKDVVRYIFSKGVLREMTEFQCFRSTVAIENNMIHFQTSGNEYSMCYSSTKIDISKVKQIAVKIGSTSYSYYVSGANGPLIGLSYDIPSQSSSSGSITGLAAYTKLSTGSTTISQGEYLLPIPENSNDFAYLVLAISGSSTSNGHLYIEEIRCE